MIRKELNLDDLQLDPLTSLEVLTEIISLSKKGIGRLPTM